MACDVKTPELFRVLSGEARHVRTTPYGSVGTIFEGADLEVVWVAKQDEEVDPGWFAQPTTDILFVAQGQLRVEFADDRLGDMVMAPGDLLVLPPRLRCRAYRWPRNARQATVFLAAYRPPTRRPPRASGRSAGR